MQTCVRIALGHVSLTLQDALYVKQIYARIRENLKPAPRRGNSIYLTYCTVAGLACKAW